MPLLRTLVVGTLTAGLALASARPALAPSIEVYLRDHDQMIATAGTDANRDWLDICDPVADGRLMRARRTGTLGLSGTLSPGDDKCATRHMHFGFKEYTSNAFKQACVRAGVIQSMGRTGSALDNAVAESFNSTLEFELLSQQTFTTRQQACRMVAAWITDYNQDRRHCTAQILSPIDYEQQHRRTA